MSVPGILLSEILDDACRMVMRTAAPWLGVLWLTSLPYRFAQAFFVRQILSFGNEARYYGDYLFSVAVVMTVTMLLSLFGKAVYVRACHLTSSGVDVPLRDIVRVPPADLLNYSFAALLIETICLLLSFLILPVMGAVLFSGAIAAVSYGSRKPGLFAVFQPAMRLVTQLRMMGGLVLLFLLAGVLVWGNLYMFGQFVSDMTTAVPGINAERWAFMFRPYEWQFGDTSIPMPFPAESTVALLLLAVTVLVLEPFWVASFVAMSARLRERKSGEDLRRWFLRLRSETQ